MKDIKVICFLVLVIILIFFTSCSSPSINSENELLGTWEFVQGENGTSANFHDLTFEKDGKLAIGNEAVGEYTLVKPNKLKISRSGLSGTFAYEIEGNILSIDFIGGMSQYKRADGRAATTNDIATKEAARSTEPVAEEVVQKGELITPENASRVKELIRLEIGSFSSLAFSPNGQILASDAGIIDPSVKLWDMRTGELLADLEGHPDEIRLLAFSPEGQTLASTDLDGNVLLWDVETKQLRASLEDHTDYINSIIFSPDGKTLVTASDDETVRMWNVQTGEPFAMLEGHEGVVYSLAFSPDGKTLATGAHRDGKILLWDGQTGEQLTTLQVSKGTVMSMTFSPDSKRLTSLCYNGSVWVWDGQANQPVDFFEEDLWILAISPNGDFYATLPSRDGTLRLWNAKTGQQISTLEGHTDDIRSVSFSPDGKTLVTSSADETVRVWDAQTGQQLAVLKGHNSTVYYSTYSPDGRSIISQGGDVRIWGIP